MNRTLRSTILGVGLAGASLIAVPAAHAAGGTPVDQSAKPLSIAVIGDVPYGTAQEASFGSLIGAVNADPKVRTVAHVGDIKSGSTTCTDERFATVADAFATFQDPLVYTPGDNEWTDCHRPNNGGYDPLERLGAIRDSFFAEPGATLGGRRKAVLAQAGLPENVRWTESDVAFATIHAVGSNNGLAPWTGRTAPTPEQLAEVDARTAGALAWIDATFDAARADQLDGVVLFMQADTWAPNTPSGLRPIVDRLAARTAGFDGEVLVVQGDTHTFKADNPLGLDNFTRLVVHGETLPYEYLRLTIDRRDPELFSWSRVAVTP